MPRGKKERQRAVKLTITSFFFNFKFLMFCLLAHRFGSEQRCVTILIGQSEYITKDNIDPHRIVLTS